MGGVTEARQLQHASTQSELALPLQINGRLLFPNLAFSDW